MKSIFLSFLMIFAFTQVRADDVTVKISKTHMCCDSCVKGVGTAVEGIDGLKATADKETKIIVLTAPDKATLQKGADALTKAGYFGESSDPDIKIDAATGAKG